MRLRLCLCRRWSLGVLPSDAPSKELLERQSSRLSALRGRVLRRLGVARLGPVLDLGTGHGAAVPELVRRSRGPVVALDRRFEQLRGGADFSGSHRVAADGLRLPFRDSVFELVHVQLVFMWVESVKLLAFEIARVLRPGGSVLAVEPDFGGLIEWPSSIALRDLWHASLSRAGADPEVGRKVSPMLSKAGLRTRVDLFNAPSRSDDDRFELLEGLPMTGAEREELRSRRESDRVLPAEEKLVHLPHLFVSGTKPKSAAKR